MRLELYGQFSLNLPQNVVHEAASFQDVVDSRLGETRLRVFK